VTRCEWNLDTRESQEARNEADEKRASSGGGKRLKARYSLHTTRYISDAGLQRCCDLLGEINDAVGITPFVVVPGDQFEELAVQLDA
jgi:hypothetical protein